MPAKKEVYKDGKTLDEYFKPGFLILAHTYLEDKHIGRSRWWIPHYFQNKVPDTPIPQIDWLAAAGRPERQQALKLLTNAIAYGSLEKFLSFILYGLGDSREEYWKTGYPDEVNRWEKALDEAFPIMYAFPWPYFTDLIEQNSSKGFKDVHGFFATPMQITEMMCKLAMIDGSNAIDATVCEPCVGTGNMLLAASNYSINLYGMDRCKTVLMGCLIHMHMYVPWAIAPLKQTVEQRPKFDLAPRQVTVEDDEAKAAALDEKIVAEEKPKRTRKKKAS